MADNLVLNAGSGGATLASDDVGGIHYQLIKLAYGALDAATVVTGSVGLPTDLLDRAARDLGKVDVALLDQYTPVDVDTGAGVDNALPVALRLPASGGGVTAPGDVTNGLDVDVTRVTGNVSVVAVNLDIRGLAAAEDIVDLGGNALASLQLIDDIVHSGDAALGKYALVGGVFDDVATDGVTENQAQSVRITSARALHVSVRDALPAGANNIGTVELSATALTALETITVAQVTAAIPAGTNNIGDVDVLTLPALPAGTNNIGDVDVLTVPAPLNVVGTGTEATALRVTLASDSTGVLSVDDNGGALTVDAVDLDIRALVAATDIVDLGGNALASLQLIDDIVHSGDAALGKYALVGGVFDDVATVGVTENQAQSVRITSARALHVSVRDALPAGANNIGTVELSATALTALETITVAQVTAAIPAGTNNIGDVDVLTLPALPAGTNNIGDVDVLSIVPGTGATALGKAEDVAHATGDTGVYTLAVRDDAPAAHSGADGDYESLHVNAQGGLWVTQTPATQGGCAIFRSLDLDETEEEVKATAGQVYGFYFHNAATAARYLKFYNATAATVVVGTTTPVLTLPLPFVSSGGVAGWIPLSPGIEFGTAITVAVTTGLADNDTGAPGANDVQINILYK